MPFNIIQKEDDTMARAKSIKYLMKTELNRMEAYGRSKHADQERTRIERSHAKAQGIPFEEYRLIDYTKDYVYSINTMKNYQHEVDRFANYLQEHGFNKISLEEAQDHVQDYLDYLEDKGLSAPSIHISCAALCKVLHMNMWEYDKPQRTIAEITRGNQTFKGKDVDMVSELEKNRIWCINRDFLGMRKNELINLRADMIKEVDNRVEIHYIGKGGKHNKQIFTLEHEKAFVLSLKQGKQGNERIFKRKEVEEAKNLHKARELRCKDVYARVVDDIAKGGEETRQAYKDEIKRIFKEAHKPLRENLDNPYHVRGANRDRLIAEGRETEYSRIALMIVSVTVSQHFRTDTTQNHYIGK